MAKETCNSKILVDIHRWQTLQGISTTRLRFCATLYIYIQKRPTTWQKGPVIQKYLSVYVAGTRCRISVQRTWALRNIVYIYTQKRPETWQKRPEIQKCLSIYIGGTHCRIWVQLVWNAAQHCVYMYIQKRPTTWQKRPVIQKCLSVCIGGSCCRIGIWLVWGAAQHCIYIYIYKRDLHHGQRDLNSEKMLVGVHRRQLLQDRSTTCLKRCATLYIYLYK